MKEIRGFLAYLKDRGYNVATDIDLIQNTLKISPEEKSRLILFAEEKGYIHFHRPRGNVRITAKGLDYLSPWWKQIYEHPPRTTTVWLVQIIITAIVSAIIAFLVTYLISK